MPSPDPKEVKPVPLQYVESEQEKTFQGIAESTGQVMEQPVRAEQIKSPHIQTPVMPYENPVTAMDTGQNVSNTEGVAATLPGSHKPLRVPGLSLNAQSALNLTTDTSYSSAEAAQLGTTQQTQREEDLRRFRKNALKTEKAA